MGSSGKHHGGYNVMAFSSGSYTRRTRGIQQDSVGNKVKLSGAVAVDASSTSQFSGDADNDFGAVTGANDDTEDLGLITASASTTIDLGLGFGENLIATTLGLPQVTVSGVSAASSANKGQIVYVSDETGGATLAFSDGTNWRRLQDRAVIS